MVGPQIVNFQMVGGEAAQPTPAVTRGSLHGIGPGHLGQNAQRKEVK